MTSNDPIIHVLLVDDDNSFREILTDELRRSGFDVTPAHDAESALQEVEDRAFEVAIVDLNLPGMGGEALIREFRDRSLTTELIVLTGHATVENAVQTMKDGAYDFLSKPCNLDELETVVRKAHEKHALIRENRLLQRERVRVRVREL